MTVAVFTKQQASPIYIRQAEVKFSQLTFYVDSKLQDFHFTYFLENCTYIKHEGNIEKIAKTYNTNCKTDAKTNAKQ